MCGERSRLRVGVGSERRYRDGGLRWAHGAARGNPSPRSPARLSAPRRCQQQSSPPGRGPGSPDSASSPPPPGESCLKSVQTNPRRAPPPPTSLHAPTAPRLPEGGGSDGAGQDPTPPCCSARKPREGFSATGGGGGGVKTQPSPIFSFYTPPSRRPLHSQLSSGHPKPLPAARGPHYERSCINVTPLSAPPASPPRLPFPPSTAVRSPGRAVRGPRAPPGGRLAQCSSEGIEREGGGGSGFIAGCRPGKGGEGGGSDTRVPRALQGPGQRVVTREALLVTASQGWGGSLWHRSVGKG